MTPWRCELQFDLRTGEFSKEAHLLLTKRGVSRVVAVPPVDGRYRYQCTIPAVMFNYALSGAEANLAAILNVYDVTFEIVEARVVKQ